MQVDFLPLCGAGKIDNLFFTWLNCEDQNANIYSISYFILDVLLILGNGINSAFELSCYCHCHCYFHVALQTNCCKKSAVLRDAEYNLKWEIGFKKIRHFGEYSALTTGAIYEDKEEAAFRCKLVVKE